ncbi:hypothetical protein WA026_015016 [Henosepilachna vigintioctopunctata]|uniref:Uncharacterized protein n=1 Tax=Henosepilachna vigintioctopunctata TaxID=420089 RepID=A0AAW1UBY5_9CUCU
MYKATIIALFVMTLCALSTSSPVPQEDPVGIFPRDGDSVGLGSLLFPELFASKALSNRPPIIIPIPIPIPVGPEVFQNLPDIPKVLKRIFDNFIKGQ